MELKLAVISLQLPTTANCIKQP